eukprot:CAMPEP_0183358854 /NCGR_PEP_ID=MMETSP0164_2-20130417/50478_1 /TAXON_ID=221442 /ORGANISM="Coccolithus pelagicus ssp braarudi, Strain PLY182g" /LENGTH=127 /DNA_ID=CAMNT_0025532833 /DNA_START=564 /DNA_END=948 /DNA_ORIENTATION=-
MAAARLGHQVARGMHHSARAQTGQAAIAGDAPSNDAFNLSGRRGGQEDSLARLALPLDAHVGQPRVLWLLTKCLKQIGRLNRPTRELATLTGDSAHAHGDALALSVQQIESSIRGALGGRERTQLFP